MDHRLHSSKPNGGGVELGPVSKGTAGADPAEHADGTVITIPDAMMLDPSVRTLSSSLSLYGFT